VCRANPVHAGWHHLHWSRNTVRQHFVQGLKNQRDLCDQPCRNHILLLRCVLGVHLVMCNSVCRPHRATGSTTVSAYHHTHLPVGVLLPDCVPQGVDTTIDRHLGKQNIARTLLPANHIQICHRHADMATLDTLCTTSEGDDQRWTTKAIAARLLDRG
jgi:hypothetical protein